MSTARCATARSQAICIIKGQGDPTLVSERLWLLMRRVRGLGINRINGDIVLDRSAFALAPTDPGRLRRRAAAALQRRARRLAAQLQVGGDDLRRRPHRQPGAHPCRPAAGRRGDSGLRAAVRRRLWRLPGQPARRLLRPDPDPLRRQLSRPHARNAPGRSPGPIRRSMPRAPSKACGARSADNSAAACATAPCRPLQALPVFEVASPSPGRSGPRHQQIQQQRDGAAAVSEPEPAGCPRRNGKAGGHDAPADPPASFAASRDVLQQWWRERLGATVEPPHGGQRLRPVAQRPHQCAGAGPAAADRLPVALDARADVLAADCRHRRHDAPQPLGRGRQRPPQDRQPARCDGGGRLCAGQQRPALCGGG